MASLLSSNDLATRLGTSMENIRQMVFRRQIPYIKHGKRLLFDPDAIDAHVAENAQDPVVFEAQAPPSQLLVERWTTTRAKGSS